jgi:hypothetical protein
LKKTTDNGSIKNVIAASTETTNTSLQDEQDYELKKFVRMQTKLEERKELARERFAANFVSGKKEITVIYKAYGGHSFTLKTTPDANFQIVFDFIGNTKYSLQPNFSIRKNITTCVIHVAYM